MAGKRARAPLPAVIQTAIESILGAIDTRDRELKAWEADGDRRPRSDHADGLARIHDDANRSIDSAATAVDDEITRIGREYARQRKTSFDEVAVAEAARRYRELRAAGLGVDEVLDPARGFVTRELLEAVRREVRVDLSVAMKGKSAAEIEARAREIEAATLGAEPALMDPIERYSAEQEISARAGRGAVEGLAKFLSSDRGAQAQISLGHALEAAGYVPPAPAEQPLAQAERERNSLSPELRASLDGNVRERPSAEPSLAVRSR